MKDRTRQARADAASQHGVPLDSALRRRERLADIYGTEYGRELMFDELVAELLANIPEGGAVLEVGAATGVATREILHKAGSVTALEPSKGMLRRLMETEVADSPRLTMVQGMVEDLPTGDTWDVAVVTFTPRRGLGLVRLIRELAGRVTGNVVMLLDDDGSLDWAYVARAASVQGFDVTMHIVRAGEGEDARRAVVLVVRPGAWQTTSGPGDAWGIDAREVHVPYPVPRGTATRLVRYFLVGSDRAMLVRTDPVGVERLYGNLRTAVHRLGREEVTVRRQGDAIQVVRLPGSSD